MPPNHPDVTHFLEASALLDDVEREALEASLAAMADSESPCLLSFCRTLKAFGLFTRPACFVSGVDGVPGDEASVVSVNRRRAAMALMALIALEEAVVKEYELWPDCDGGLLWSLTRSRIIRL